MEKSCLLLFFINFIYLFFFLLQQGDTRISLPSSVFASHVEEKVGVLNKAAPKKGE